MARRRKADPLSRYPELIEEVYRLSLVTTTTKGYAQPAYSSREIAQELSTREKRVITSYQVEVLWNTYGQGRRGFIQEVDRRKDAKESLLLSTHVERMRMAANKSRQTLDEENEQKRPKVRIVANDLSEDVWLLVADSLMRTGGNTESAVKERKLLLSGRELQSLIRRKYKSTGLFYSYWDLKVHAKRKELGLRLLPNPKDGTG